MEESHDASFLDTTEFQKIFGHDPGRDKDIMKIAIVGYPGTGKSAFIKKFCDQVLPIEHKPSMHTEITSEIIRVSSSIIVEVFLYEIAGQTQYVDLRNLFSFGVQGIIILFSHNYAYTFHKVPYLLSFIDKYMITPVPKLLVGNLFNDIDPQVTYEDALQMAKTLGIDYIRINVKNNSNSVDSCIGYFVSKLIIK